MRSGVLRILVRTNINNKTDVVAYAMQYLVAFRDEERFSVY